MITHLLNKHCRECYKILFSGRRNYVTAGNGIRKLLIANRGEIACRVAKTAKRLGIKVVAVYSDADANALHVSLADEAYHIGPSASSESYLRGDKLLAVAHKAGCSAVHPGYGFLSENADFAEQCLQAGVTFIGPPASAIRDMGCKSTSKKIMEGAGVPVVKGYHGDEQADARLKAEASKIGYPVMLKALKGGGGKGMRVVLSEAEFEQQLSSARNEAQKAFGDTAMLVEAFVLHPRHVEVQVFGDHHGNYVHLHERDCSVQRRHQKVIEEAPAPGLNDSVRRSLGETAVKAARAVGYVGAGTVEFILDADTLQHYFMEMNTRLQVEHPVTEMITGADLVEWQLKVASGEPLPLRQDEISARGHAFEARIYAEDPDQGFLPQAGVLRHLKLPSGPEPNRINPSAAEHVRVDTGVRSGDPVPVFYDPLIAKLIVWAEDRQRALRLLENSLTEFHVSGVPTNINFLLALSRHKEFQSGRVHTNFIAKHGTELLCSRRPDDRAVATAVAAQLLREGHGARPDDPFKTNPGFRVNHYLERKFTYCWKDEAIPVIVQYLPSGSKKIIYQRENKTDEFIFSYGGEVTKDDAIFVETLIDGSVSRASVVCDEFSVQIFSAEGVMTLDIPPPNWKKTEQEDLSGADEDQNQKAASPMPGVVDQVMVNAGDSVTKNQPLVTVIAMKMEYIVRAPADGVVSEVLHKSGDAVSKGAILVRFLEEASESSLAQAS